MTGMANVVFCTLFFILITLLSFTMYLYFRTEPTKVPKPGHKMFFAYKVGEWTFKGFIAACILGLAAFFIYVLTKATK